MSRDVSALRHVLLSMSMQHIVDCIYSDVSSAILAFSAAVTVFLCKGLLALYIVTFSNNF